MRFISSLYTYCVLVWAVYATPLPVPQDTAPSGSVDQKDPIVRAPDVFQRIVVERAALADIEESLEGRDYDGSDPGAHGGCVIA